MGCILPTMHCRSQHCWELLHAFADHCQHASNNSQHCWCNNVGSQQCWELLRPFARSLRVARVASSPGGDAICGMLVIALDLAPNGFSPGTPVLPLSLKFIQISVRSGNVDKEPFYWCVTRISIYNFSYCWPSTSEARHVFRYTGADPHWFPAFSRNRSGK